MKQNYFERNEVHTRVAALLAKDGWIYHHEYPFANGKRADFVAFHPATARIAVVECKTAISSTEALIEQINGYHDQLGYPHALKWAFIWATPHSGTLKRLRVHNIVTFPMDQEPDIDPVVLGHASKDKFRKLFKQFKELTRQMDDLESQRLNVLSQIAKLAYTGES